MKASLSRAAVIVLLILAALTFLLPPQAAPVRAADPGKGDSFRLVEVRVNRSYMFQGSDAADKKLFKDGQEVFKDNPGKVEIGASRSWYDHKAVLTVDAPSEVQDGQAVTLKAATEATWEFSNPKALDPVNFGIDVSVGFRYQKAEGDKLEGSGAKKVSIQNSHMLKAATSCTTTVKHGSESATFEEGDTPDTRIFFVSMSSSVIGGGQAIIEETWVYKRGPATTGGQPGPTTGGSQNKYYLVDAKVYRASGPYGGTNTSGKAPEQVFKGNPDTITFKSERPKYTLDGSLKVVCPPVLEAGQTFNVTFQGVGAWNLQDADGRLQIQRFGYYMPPNQQDENLENAPPGPQTLKMDRPSQQKFDPGQANPNSQNGVTTITFDLGARFNTQGHGDAVVVDVVYTYANDPKLAGVSGVGPPPGGSGTPGPTPPLPEGMILLAPDLIVAKGTRVLVPVQLINAKDVHGMDFELAYLPDVTAAQPDAEQGSVLSETWQYNLKQPGLFKFNFAQLAAGINGQGTVAGFRFDAVGPGRSRTPLTLSVHRVDGPNGAKLPITVINGSITIYDPTDLTDPNNPNNPNPPGPPGGPRRQPTCSGTGILTVNDAQCCLKKWVELIPTTKPDDIMDLNHDGVVDSADALEVLRRIKEELPK